MTEEEKKKEEEELRKAWEARLRYKRNASTVVIDSTTGRRVRNKTEIVYADIVDATDSMGTNERAGW